MRSASRQLFTRVLKVAAALLAVFVITMTAGPAYAAPGATGHLAGVGAKGLPVQLNGAKKPFYTALINIQLNNGGKVVQTYCIDQKVETAGDAAMVEDDWANYPNKGDKFSQPDKVLWILQHSFPNLAVDKVGAAALIKGLTEQEAIAGTQAAIWHFSNGVDLATGGKHGANDAQVVALYNYLTGVANVGEAAQPAPTLDITPAKATGTAGKLIGPFVVKSSTKSVPLTVKGPAGVKLVDANGDAITSVANGGKAYLKVPASAAAGKATITGALQSAAIETGRLFRGDNVVTQTLITATTTPVSAKKMVWASWTKGGTQPTPSASPSQAAPPTVSVSTSPAGASLPVTGTNVALFGGIGAVLLLIGGGLFFVARRKRTA
ncbi:Cys-Gln thioester bond-forming surface protein [Fodinicola feengrottensis]